MCVGKSLHTKHLHIFYTQKSVTKKFAEIKTGVREKGLQKNSNPDRENACYPKKPHSGEVCVGKSLHTKHLHIFYTQKSVTKKFAEIKTGVREKGLQKNSATSERE